MKHLEDLATVVLFVGSAVRLDLFMWAWGVIGVSCLYLAVRYPNYRRDSMKGRKI